MARYTADCVEREGGADELETDFINFSNARGIDDARIIDMNTSQTGKFVRRRKHDVRSTPATLIMNMQPVFR